MSLCPEESTLRLLGTDAVGDATYAAIEEHVEECPECKELLDRLAHRPTDCPVVLPSSRRSPRIPGFEIHGELGRGAMGVVYLATQTQLRRQVALKILSGVVDDAIPIARRRWLREARAVSSIRHPNVVPLFDYGEEDGWFYLVLEYIPGGSLKKRLLEPVSSRAAARLVETIARAVGHIHGKGLLHLDLKPSNILLDCEDNASWDRVIPRVSDFGLAISDDADVSETSLAGPRGTPSYMAPEQTGVSPTKIGPAVDIYALGAILFEILTGRPPFQGTSTIETLDQVRLQEPVPPRRLNPAIPPDLETICLTCLQKDPGRRYASAEALAEDLRRWLDGHSILARPVSSFEKAWRWCGRRPAVAALASLLVLTLSAGFFSVFLLWRYAEAARTRAKADFEVAAEALGGFIELSGAESPFRASPASRLSVLHLLQKTRKLCFELAARRPDRPIVHRRLALADFHLACLLLEQRKLTEARPLFVESLASWSKVVERSPQDIQLLSHQAGTIELLANVADVEGRTEESASLFSRAVELDETVVRLRPDTQVVRRLADFRWTLARLLESLGDHERARSLIEANTRLLDNIPQVATSPELAIRRVMAHDHLRRVKTNAKFSTSTTAGPVGTDALSRLLSPEADRMSARVWAELFAQVLRSAAANEGTSPSREPEAGYLVPDFLAARSASLRRSDKLDEARRTADRMHAFAQVLVSTHPDQPAAHLTLSRAFNQFAKNALQINDRAAVEQNRKLALDEARHALRLDPQDARARNEATALQRRLDDLLATRGEAVTHDRPVPSTIR